MKGSIIFLIAFVVLAGGAFSQIISVTTIPPLVTTTSLLASACGDESISLGSKGEVKLKLQTNGTESNTCWPTECSLKFYTASTTVISDKYSVNGTQTFSYQKFCIAGADEIKALKCSSKINNETKKCAPAVCSAGSVEIGLLDELRDFSEGNWTQNVYRLCAKGNIESATTVFKEQT